MMYMMNRNVCEELYIKVILKNILKYDLYDYNSKLITQMFDNDYIGNIWTSMDTHYNAHINKKEKQATK